MKWLKYLVVFFCIISLTGCATLFQKDKNANLNAPLEPQPLLKFYDIPVPAGFKLLIKDSYAFESTGMRVGVLKYRGRAHPDRVSNFYKEQMPMYNWRLLNIIEYGERLMNFERENETCIVNLLPKGSTVTITISLGPKSKMASQDAKKKLK